MNREVDPRKIRMSYSSGLRAGKENGTVPARKKTGKTPVKAVSKPTLAIRPTSTTTARPTLANRTTVAAKPVTQELPVNDEWKQKLSEMESVFGLLSTQVMTLTEQFSSTKSSIDAALNQPRFVTQPQPQPMPQFQFVQEIVEPEPIIYEEMEPIIEERIVEEIEEVEVSEEEPEEPEIDVSIFTVQIASLNALLQEQMKANTKVSETQILHIEMLNNKLQMTQTNIDEAQNTLQSLQKEASQSNSTLLELDFQKKKIETEMKFTTERLQEELKATREQLVNQIKSTSQEFTLEIETKKTKLRRVKELSEEKKKKNLELEEILLGHKSVNSGLNGKVEEAEENRRKMCDSIQEMKGNIRILCRVTPYQEELTNAALDFEFPFDNPTEFTITNGTQKNQFKFDRAFPLTSSQDDVFAEVFHLVESVVTGKNSCIFSYGQSGSGKSYTLLGSQSEQGIIQKSVSYLSSVVSDLCLKDGDYSMFLGAFAVRNETLIDQFTNKEIQIKYLKSGQLDFHFSQEKILSVDDLNMHISNIAANRNATKEDNYHSIFQLFMKKKTATEFSTSTLTFVDLNRSEKHSSLQDISLVNLGHVFGALTNNQKFVPFKDSKLTEVLCDLIASSKKTMITHISPFIEDYKTTITTLQFAAKVGSCEISKKVQSK